VKVRQGKQEIRNKAVIDLDALYKKLIENSELYFSNGRMNSEGRKVFEMFARVFLQVFPEHKPMIVRIRKQPTIENFLRVKRLVQSI